MSFVVYLDAMVMDNNEAEKREHIRPTYKKCKGFNALQLTWEGYLADTSLRPGHIHSNSGRSAERMILRMMKTIRNDYRADVPIIRAEIPGMNSEDMDIRLEDGNLVLSKHEGETRDEKRNYVEKSYDRFQRTIPVSGELKEGVFKASFKNGVPTVRLPKNKVEGHTKKIPVETE